MKPFSFVAQSKNTILFKKETHYGKIFIIQGEKK